MVADRLAKDGIIEKPAWLKGQQLSVHIGKFPHFPTYGMDDNVTDFMRLVFRELYLQGIIVPGPIKRRFSNSSLMSFLDLDVIRFTPYGVSVLTDIENRIQVHDPDGYLANFWNAKPKPDPEMMRYLVECVSVFRSGHLLASVVLLGIASERLIEYWL
jgi:hypothetical protein